MSLRNVKKLQAKLTQDESDTNEHSDNDYEPPCVKESSLKSAFQGLTLSSDEDADSGATSEVEKKEERRYLNDKGPGSSMEATPGPSGLAAKKTKTEKRKKKKNKKAQSISSTNALDEVEQSVSEVNAMLGEPSAPQIVASAEENEQDEKERLFSIKPKHVNASIELSRLFGPETEKPSKRLGRRPNLNRLYKCKIIQKSYPFSKLGLSMSVVYRDAKKICFTFDHSREYQKMHTEFVLSIHTRKSILIAPVEVSLKYMHVEGLIEVSEVMFRLEDSNTASDIIEQAIAYMQYAALPSFNLLDLRTRLEYKYPENRAFHIMVLKYIHLLSNRACHRTGMELAKILLNLDPSDPLAVTFFIDILALRAREHNWLLDAIVYLEEENMTKYMFNIKFSRALAQFYLSSPESEERETADAYIQHALLTYPWALNKILKCANHGDLSVLEFELYNNFANATTGQDLKSLINLYAAFTTRHWRDSSVMEWLLHNAKMLGKAYNEDPIITQAAQTHANESLELFSKGWPDSIHRHLIIINTMSDLLIENGMPSVNWKHSYDPVPPSDSVIRYDCTPRPAEEPNGTNDAGSLFGDFFASMLPSYRYT